MARLSRKAKYHHDKSNRNGALMKMLQKGGKLLSYGQTRANQVAWVGYEIYFRSKIGKYRTSSYKYATFSYIKNYDNISFMKVGTSRVDWKRFEIG